MVNLFESYDDARTCERQIYRVFLVQFPQIFCCFLLSDSYDVLRTFFSLLSAHNFNPSRLTRVTCTLRASQYIKPNKTNLLRYNNELFSCLCNTHIPWAAPCTCCIVQCNQSGICCLILRAITYQSRSFTPTDWRPQRLTHQGPTWILIDIFHWPEIKPADTLLHRKYLVLVTSIVTNYQTGNEIWNKMEE